VRGDNQTSTKERRKRTVGVRTARRMDLRLGQPAEGSGADPPRGSRPSSHPESPPRDRDACAKILSRRRLQAPAFDPPIVVPRIERGLKAHPVDRPRSARHAIACGPPLKTTKHAHLDHRPEFSPIRSIAGGAYLRPAVSRLVGSVEDGAINILGRAEAGDTTVPDSALKRHTVGKASA
jgi:hypothetical protein